jgi:hypothetical protein
MSSLVRVVLVVVLVASTAVVVSGRSEALYVPETMAHRAAVGAQSVDTPFPIDHIGVLWDLEHGHVHDHGQGDGHDRVAAHNIDGLEPNGAVRFLDADGRWGQWIRLLEDGAEGAGHWASGLVAADGAVAYQLRGIPPEAIAPRAVAINVTDGPPVAVADRPADAADALTICLSRAEWGADESLRVDDSGNEIWPPAHHGVQGLVVHHTATANDDPDPEGRVRAIYRYHAVDRGWGDIGYHYLVDEDGRVYEGRWSGVESKGCDADGDGSDFAHDTEDRLVTAGHIGGANSGNVGVALLGEFTAHPRLGAEPKAAAVAALEDVLAGLAVRHGLDPMGTVDYVNPVNGDTEDGVDTISSHRDWTSTECPGERLYDQLPTIRHNVDAKAGEVVVEEPALTVAITSPDGGSTVSGGVPITADARNDNGVEQVEFFVGNVLLRTDTDGTDGWRFDWDSNAVSDGRHTLSATATDTAGQTATASITVTVANLVAELTVGSVTPNHINPGEHTLTIAGTGFADDASVLFEGGKGPTLDVVDVTWIDADRLAVTIWVKSGGPSGSWDVRVTSGGMSAVLPDGLYVAR